IDKAGNNYAIICKKLYVKFMESEMMSNATQEQTYIMVDNINHEDIIRKHLCQTIKFGLQVAEEPMLPKIYAIPKMHKDPIKARFITGAYNSSLKALSIELQLVLKHIKSHFQRYCKVIKERT